MAGFVIKEIDRVQQAANCLREGDLEGLGKLLFLSHEGLSKQYKVSCEELDFLVHLAKENPSVLGARMMGGGFGGCTINLVYKAKSHSFIKEAQESYVKKFGTACSVYRVNLDDGTRICRPLK